MTLSRDEMRARALAFTKRFQGHQREESEAKTFLDQFFEIFGRDRHAVDAIHEYRVERPERGEGRIDLLWPGKLLVEMKSTGRDLSMEKGGAAYQAFEYLPHLDAELQPRWVLVSDFAHFVLYDRGEEVHEYLKGFEPARTGKRAPIAAVFSLEELPQKLRHFAFIRDEEQALFQVQPEINQKAVALLGKLHDALKHDGYTGHQLERLLVRILFCLFAEDTDIFAWNTFTRFVERSNKDGRNLGERLGKLFQILDTPEVSRSPHLTSDYAPFRYVNGGLFAERLDLADTTADHRSALLACCRFDWSRISPSIFGSLFQGVMEPVERRAKGAHYTSEENIRRVIDPLFIDDLHAEFSRLRSSQPLRGAESPAPISRRGKMARSPLEDFHDRLAALRFLDPACGCGNFLVVAYRELRALELDVLKAIYGDQLTLGLEIGDLARINVDQFYGIELEEFPALIAETALWLTDHQVNLSFSKAFGKLYTRIPLKKSPTIVHGNALRLDWKAILPPEKCSYVLGNPPFIGKHYQSPDQKSDMAVVFGDFANTGDIDYVVSWFVKAAVYTKNTSIRCAFVATNSITQGEQVPIAWGLLLQKHRIKIHFAHRTFVWANEASGKAHVHVVIIGFGHTDVSVKRLFDYEDDGRQNESKGTLPIGPYLTPGSETFVTKRRIPLSDVPDMRCGNKPSDGGHFIFTDVERAEFLNLEPGAKKLFRRFTGSEEFINGGMRWCLWLKDVAPHELRALPEVMKRVEAVRDFRKASSAKPTREAAQRPTEFFYISQPDAEFIAIPEVSSERRVYIPIGYLRPETIPSNKIYIVAAPSLFVFGGLSSAMHMAWVRQVGGRLESRFQYSGSMVYNTFPWPEPDAKQRVAVEKAAQAVLDARTPRLEEGSSLADLYDPLTMPAELVKAHKALDHAVDKCYRPASFTSERERVEFLFGLYEKLASPLALTAKTKTKRQPKKSAVGYTQAEVDAAHHYSVQEEPTKTE
ncbi:MAG: class I SAM-dependent DNA methyltransferase [Verrucomicrobia bacterium]|nr:class I SAM-dependent DNA methyltransferase [Verrucomicrobiota bacterium]